MSALGQKRTCAAQKVMSALPPKANTHGTAHFAVGKKVPPSELLAHSVTHQHRDFRVRQHLVCHAAEHDCG